jgi:dienelactone hydrolase
MKHSSTYSSRRDWFTVLPKAALGLGLGTLWPGSDHANAQSAGRRGGRGRIEEFLLEPGDLVTGLERDFTVGVRDLAEGITPFGAWEPIRWRFYRPPNLPGDQKIPLVVFLHGAGEHGDDNMQQLSKHGQPLLFVQPEFQEKHPCYFLAPQLEEGMPWWIVNEDLSSSGITMLVRALAEILDRWPLIDRQRIYAVGLSTGGGGCWDAMCKLPHLFAASLILGGIHVPDVVRGDIRGAAWLCYNAGENASVREGGDAMLDEFAARGLHCRRSIAKGMRDHASWTWALFQEGVAEWLWQQNLGFEDPDDVPPLIHPLFEKNIWQPKHGDWRKFMR